MKLFFTFCIDHQHSEIIARIDRLVDLIIEIKFYYLQFINFGYNDCHTDIC